LTTDSAAARFDHALRHARKRCTAPDRPAPQPSAAWPKENVALLEQYRDWLLGGGTGVGMVEIIYVPTAGYALGLNLKPYPEWDLDTDLDRALEYIHARRLSAISTHIRHNALEKFRSFLRQQRGAWDVRLRPVSYARYTQGLPDWLLEPLTRYFHLMRSHWRPARVEQQGSRFWSGHVRLWRWLLEHYPITGLLDVKRQYLLDYVDHRLTAGYAASSINSDLRCFHTFLLYLQDQDVRIPQALLRVPSLKQPERLPRFLTDEQVGRLRDDFEQRVAQAQSAAQRRDALLDRAAFYLLWQGGLRLGEVEELRLDDLDLAGRKLMVRQGKGQKDRAVYLTDTAVRALHDYLTARGPGPTEHVFFYRNRPVCKDLIRERIRNAGKRTGIAVSPHRLRHTCGTQLVNAGCRITSIQKLLGHRELSSTLVYARVHDQTVAADYYAAMTRIEKSLDLTAAAEDASEPLSVDLFARAQLLALANRLAEPQLGLEMRLELVEQLRGVLTCQMLESARRMSDVR
jgi:site-specific recombinase XerD